MKSSVNTCKFCGRPIGVITSGIYRKVVVDAEAVDVVADPNGDEIFIRIDGSKLRGREVRLDSDYKYEVAYRPHRISCAR